MKENHHGKMMIVTILDSFLPMNILKNTFEFSKTKIIQIDL